MEKNKFSYKWKFSDYPKKNGLKVFTTFACGGGSTMGYKLAGFEVVGASDIDKKMAEVYQLNHKPKHYFLGDIRDLKNKELPKELFDIDILDGSPPCSSFSMAGRREKDWGKEKKFKEGQAKQVLDDLFFHFLDLANHLNPKVIIAENVKGLIQGNAKGYTIKIIKKFNQIGYNLQVFCLNAASMGVPQKRERIFFIASRKDLNFKPLQLNFDEPIIPFGKVEENSIAIGKPLTEKYEKYWHLTLPGHSFEEAYKRYTGKPHGYFSSFRLSRHKPIPTITSTEAGKYCHPLSPNMITDQSMTLCQSFPLDYNFNKLRVQYVLGMSVPPIMMAQIANQVNIQWFKKE